MKPKKYKINYYQCKKCKNFVYRTGDLCDCDSEIPSNDEKIIEKFEMEIEDNWSGRIVKGNIVKWDDEIWIVSKVNETSLDLISASASNCGAGPSINWPFDPNERIHKIEVVASCLKDYIKKSLNKLFDGIKI